MATLSQHHTMHTLARGNREPNVVLHMFAFDGAKNEHTIAGNACLTRQNVNLKPFKYLKYTRHSTRNNLYTFVSFGHLLLQYIQ